MASSSRSVFTYLLKNVGWAAINEREPQAVHKETEKAWGAAKGGAAPGSSSPFLVASSTEFLSELQRGYAKLSTVSTYQLSSLCGHKDLLEFLLFYFSPST
jgi:hypothetical protein